VYFSSPPVDGLPKLPGELIEQITAPTPMMVGEFRDPDGTDWAMVVNLSLEKSSKFNIDSRQSQMKIFAMSPVDGSLSAIEPENSLWLPAGQGVLMKFAPISSTKTAE
jgi:hypothetical protein